MELGELEPLLEVLA